MFYLNTIEQLFLFNEQLDQLEVCLPYSRLLTGIQILVVFQNLRWNSNKTSLKIVTTIVFKTVKIVATIQYETIAGQPFDPEKYRRVFCCAATRH